MTTLERNKLVFIQGVPEKNTHSLVCN